MKTLSIEEYKTYSKIVEDKYKKHLKKHDVKTVLYYRSKKPTTVGIVICTFAKYIGQIVKKEELEKIVEGFTGKKPDVQSARQLATEKGYYVVSGKRKDILAVEKKMVSGEYLLHTLEEPYPGYISDKRKSSLSDKDWAKLKNEYDNKCANCGSVEGKPNELNKSKLTLLTQGHMDPYKPLTYDNTIPQCEICNRPAKDKFKFNKKGQISSINDPHFFLKSEKKVIIDAIKLFANEYSVDELIKIVEEIKLHEEN